MIMLPDAGTITRAKPNEVASSLVPETDLGRGARPILSRALERVLESPDGPDEVLRTSGLVQSLLEDALRERASDVHLDPDTRGYQVRFRIDGAVTDTIRLSRLEGLRVLRACKSVAGLDAGSNRVPEDGRAEFPVLGHSLGVRVATTPTVAGEKLTLRMLQTNCPRLSLDQVGLSPSDYELVRNAVQDARGMVIVSGPTGSGKTTTLYAILQELLPRNKAIVTIEDPVEYLVEGITQIQVNAKQGLTFSEGARGLLRLDPDVIFMGEMRDSQSSRVALDIADTGHLFLSSLHARDAVATITALRNYGLQDFEIAASLDMIIAQRLVRRLCERCRREEAPAPDEEKWLFALGQPIPKKTWRPVGCPECAMTGYRGRVGIFEVWRIHEEEADIILQHADEHTLRRRFRKTGMSTFLEDDMAKVNEGITSLAEIRAMGGFGYYSQPVAAATGKSAATSGQRDATMGAKNR